MSFGGFLGIAGFTSTHQLTDWAFRQLPVKSTLAAGDAQRVEEAFQEKLESLGNSNTNVPASNASTSVSSNTLKKHPRELVASDAPLSPRADIDTPPKSRRRLGGRIDKSVLAIGEPRRHRDKEHLKFVRTQACLICGRQPSDPHHLRFTQPRALSRKVSDEYTVPLCRAHHREVHRCANEPSWWAKYNLNPLLGAEALWRQSHPVGPMADPTSDDPKTGPANHPIGVMVVSLLEEPRNDETNPIDGAGGRSQ